MPIFCFNLQLYKYNFKVMKYTIARCEGFVILLALILIFPSFSNAQKKMLTMDDAIVKSRTTLAPKRLQQLMWVKGTNDYTYVDTSNSKEVILRSSVKDKADKEYLNLVSFNAELKKLNLDTLKHFPTISWKDKDHFSFENKKKMLVYYGKEKKLVIEASKDLPDSAENQETEPTTGVIAYTIDNNLYIYKDNAKVQVTDDSDKNIVNG